MAAKEPATTFTAPAVATAVELDEVPEPVPVGVTLEVNVVPGTVAVVEFTPLPALGVKVGKVVGAEVVVETVDEALEERDEDALVDETDAELVVLLTETLALELEMEMELELELVPLEAAMWNGKEYWKVAGSESRLIFKP